MYKHVLNYIKVQKVKAG